MGRTFQKWVYTDDQGHTFFRRAAADIVGQEDTGIVKVGGAASAGYHPRMPKTFKPRVAVCVDGAGVKYRVVCYENDAPLFTTIGTTLNLYDRDGGAAIPVTSIGGEGERKWTDNQ